MPHVQLLPLYGEMLILQICSVKIDALEKKFGAQRSDRFSFPISHRDLIFPEYVTEGARGYPQRYLVPDAVRVYMEEKGLYQDE
ncbi:MAG: hypothetical protein ACLVGL_02180 [Waltera sp.]